LEDQHHNWTGDEPIQHAVLRMLVDKYKPLRGGVIRTAEEKLRDAPPTSVASITKRDWASEPLLPGVDGHRPWHTTFTAPSTSVRVGRFADSPSSAKPTARAGQARERTKQLEKEQRRRAHEVQRMSKAKESTLDYKLGIKSNVGIVNPVSLKGWNSLIEERIEV
jgi:DnaJ family protein C protein 28